MNLSNYYTKIKNNFKRSSSSTPFIIQQIYFTDQVTPPFIIQQIKAKNESLASNRTIEKPVMVYNCSN